MDLNGLVFHVEGAEGGGIRRKRTLDGGHLGHQALDNVADCHTGGDAVGVHNHIRDDALH